MITNFIEQIRSINPKLLEKKVPITCPECKEIFYRRISSRNWQCGKCRTNINRDFIRNATLDFLKSVNYEIGDIKHISGFKSGENARERYIKTIIVKFLDIISIMKNNDIRVEEIKTEISKERERLEIISELIGEVN